MIDADFAFLYDDIDDFAPAVAETEDAASPGAGTSGAGTDASSDADDDFYNPDEMDEAPEDDGIIVCGTHTHTPILLLQPHTTVTHTHTTTRQ